MDKRKFLKALLRGEGWHISKIRVYDTHGGTIWQEVTEEVTREAVNKGLLSGVEGLKQHHPISITDGIALMKEKEYDGKEDLNLFWCVVPDDYARALAFIEKQKKQEGQD